MTPKSQKTQLILISAGLVLLIGAAFEPIRHNGFVDFDDPIYITDNQTIQSGLTTHAVAWAFFDGRPAYWHPLTWMSHLVDIELFGTNPLGHHIHSVILHACSTILLFWILCDLTGAVWASAFVAMVFGIHPLRVESVAWAAERKDVLCSLFWMLTLLAYQHYARHGGVLRYLAVLFCFGLGLMAKPMLVTLPIILLLLDWWPLRRIQNWQPKITSQSAIRDPRRFRIASLTRLIAEKIPLVILAFASCLITYKIHQDEGSISSVPFLIRFLNAMSGYTAYISKIILPVDLAVLYPFPVHAYPLWQPIISCIALAACTGLIINSLHKRPCLLVGWLWFIISLVPVIGLVQAGSQTMADRYSYLPSIGIGLMIAWATMELTVSWKHKKIVLAALSGLVMTAMVFGTRNQLGYWKDSLALYEHTLAVTKDNLIIQNNLSLLLFKLGKYNQAADIIVKTIDVFPDSADANINMATLLMVRGQIDNAQTFLQNAIRYKPDSVPAYYNMGLLQEVKKQPEDALVSYEKVLRLDQTNVGALDRIGIIKSNQGHFDQALNFFSRSISINPNDAEAYRNLGWLQAVHPDSAIHNPSKAIQAAQKACQLTAFKKPEMLDTLAAAYAANGQFKEAIETAQKAYDAAAAAGKTDMAEGISSRLQLYRTGKPYLDSPSQN